MSVQRQQIMALQGLGKGDNHNEIHTARTNKSAFPFDPCDLQDIWNSKRERFIVQDQQRKETDEQSLTI